MEIEKSQSPFYSFRHCKIFQKKNFVLKLGFSGTYIRFLFKTGVLLSGFLICFHRSPSLSFTRNETFCERKGLFKVFGTMRITGDLHQKVFEKFRIFLSPVFCFFLKKSFPLRKMGFLLFPVGEGWFSRPLRVPSDIFGAVKLMKI